MWIFHYIAFFKPVLVKNQKSKPPNYQKQEGKKLQKNLHTVLKSSSGGEYPPPNSLAHYGLTYFRTNSGEGLQALLMSHEVLLESVDSRLCLITWALQFV